MDDPVESDDAIENMLCRRTREQDNGGDATNSVLHSRETHRTLPVATAREIVEDSNRYQSPQAQARSL